MCLTGESKEKYWPIWMFNCVRSDDRTGWKEKPSKKEENLFEHVLVIQCWIYLDLKVRKAVCLSTYMYCFTTADGK